MQTANLPRDAPQVYPKVRLHNAQWNWKKPHISDSKCFTMLNVKVYGSTIRTWLNRCDLFVRAARESVLRLIWARFAATGRGHLSLIELTMKFSVFQSVLESNVRASVQHLKLGWNRVIQQDSDPKYSSKSTTEWLKKKRIGVLPWSSQSPDLNLIEMQSWDIKRAMHQTNVANLNELKQNC